MDETVLPLARRVPGVAAVAPLVLADVVVPEAGGAVLLVAGIDVVSDRAVRDYTFRWTEGDKQDPFAVLTQPQAIVLSERFAQRYGFRLGAAMQIYTSQGIQQLVVRGLLRPEGAAEALGGHFAIMDIAAAQVLFDRVGRLDRIDVVPRQDFPLETLQATLQQRLGPGVQVRRPQARNQAVEKMLRSFHVNLTALSLIALIVGMFLIYNSTTIAVVQRRRELGILRALGVARRRLFLLLLSEACGTALLGALLGVGLGLLLARLALRLVSPAVSTLYVLEHVTHLTAHVGYGADWYGTRDWHGAPVGRLANADSLTPQSPGRHATTRGLQRAARHRSGPVTLVGLGLAADRLWSLPLTRGGRGGGLWISRLPGAGAGGFLSRPAGISGYDPCRAADPDALARG